MNNTNESAVVIFIGFLLNKSLRQQNFLINSPMITVPSLKPPKMFSSEKEKKI
jgi:hypothetical protein